MSSIVVKYEEIGVDTNGYNSEDIEQDLNLAFEETSEVFNQQIAFTKPCNQNEKSCPGSSLPNTVSTQQHRNKMNISVGTEIYNLAAKTNTSTKYVPESEKRIRREIANSNERRRMQSINAGFQNLRALLPRHEGEKLSKAAILQQTSQYICDLENQKTQLLAQNSQLKRTLGQHELALSGFGSGNAANIDDGCSATKKRKLTDNILSVQTISDSSDEGLGSVSPEPTLLVQAVTNANNAGNAYLTYSAKEFLELKKQLEKERRFRAVIEGELRLIKRQLYKESCLVREFSDRSENIRDENGAISYAAINDKNEPSEIVSCSSITEVLNDSGNINDENTQKEFNSTREDDVNKCSALQPILQAAIKAKPKVEVERINESVVKTNTGKDSETSQDKRGSNSIALTRSRQNLETIVEAIRHLEGDHLFGESLGQQNKTHKLQESPLALTKKQLVCSTTVPSQHQQQQQRKTIAELSPFIQIKNPKIGATNIVTIVRGKSISLAPSSGDKSLTMSNAIKTPPQINTAALLSINSSSISGRSKIVMGNSAAIPTAIVKVQPNLSAASTIIAAPPSNIIITTASLKQCRPGVIVEKQLS